MVVVFPMHVGVFLAKTTITNAYERLPHARGGVSANNATQIALAESSPCTWGCFSDVWFFGFDCAVFPMHVGVFLSKLRLMSPDTSLPHARGGVSQGER